MFFLLEDVLLLVMNKSFPFDELGLSEELKLPELGFISLLVSVFYSPLESISVSLEAKHSFVLKS